MKEEPEEKKLGRRDNDENLSSEVMKEEREREGAGKSVCVWVDVKEKVEEMREGVT